MEEIEKIKQEQYKIHRKFVREGWYYKLICILAVYPLMYLGYLFYGPERQKRDHLDDSTVIYYLIVLGIIMALIIVFTNPLKFINDYRIRRQNRLFKKEFFELARKSIPELDEHNSIQKLHPVLFKESHLFSGWTELYTGDDFMSGIYEGKRFDLGELHVINSLRTVFRGLYLVIYIKQEIDGATQKVEALNASEEFLKLSREHEIRSVFRNQRFYLSISYEDLVFENQDKKRISKLDKDLDLLQSLVGAAKKAIEVLES